VSNRFHCEASFNVFLKGISILLPAFAWIHLAGAWMLFGWLSHLAVFAEHSRLFLGWFIRLVYVADNGNGRIVVYSILGGKLATFGDSFDPISSGPLLKDAQGMTLSNNGRQLFVCDAGYHCVRVFDTEMGGYLRSIGSGPGKAPGNLNFPTFVATSHFGDIYVSDTLNSRIQVTQTVTAHDYQRHLLSSWMHVSALVAVGVCE
jgi:hypothetical protein